MPPKACILCADDDPSVLYTMKLVLEHGGYRVLTAENGPEAIRLLHSQRVDLVLLDSFPDQKAIVSAARQANPEMRLLLCTGEMAKPDLTGLDGVVHKPMPPLELFRLIERTLVL
jgi:two-component system response regulator GlrR